MALVEDESLLGNEVEIEEEQVFDTPTEEKHQEPVVESVVPEKYKGKSLDDIVRMHQEAEKMIGRQAQEVHEVRQISEQDLLRK